MPRQHAKGSSATSTIALETGAGLVSVTVNRSRRRSLQLSIDREGAITFRIPFATTTEHAQAILKSRSEWIERTRVRIMRRLPKRRWEGYVDGAEVYVLGKSRILHVQKTADDWPRFYGQEDGWLCCVPAGYSTEQIDSTAGKAMEIWLRREASEYLSKQLELWAARMELRSPQLFIKRHKWLWGSCNKLRRTVNLNWKIISFPAEIIDYVIIHELCHLQVADHSRRFWTEVAKWCPNWRQLRKWLREEAYRHVLPA
ncbi:MAG: M48 family metallopeptidase [Candidatus Omnitrophica bacterium]|nr:M48 family metallopeptidase [Candidatus Omnitrophota bacterium]